jgi:hypothetical protein
MIAITLLFLCTTLVFVYTTWIQACRAEHYEEMYREAGRGWDKCFERGEERLEKMRFERDRLIDRLRKIDPEFPEGI